MLDGMDNRLENIEMNIDLVEKNEEYIYNHQD
jgi:hypothetical protein